MKRDISLSGKSVLVEYLDKCPVCHHYSNISFIRASKGPGESGIQVILQCAYPGCQSFILCQYGSDANRELKAMFPQKVPPTEFPELVRQLSPSFLEIYEEAAQAQHLGMKQIAGPGFRKAFEFLVKDYAKSVSPNRAQEIKAMFSGTVVNEFISDARIQAMAKRALWLGNDETHYLRKWTSHDIDDLTTLIKLSINWIEIEQLSKDYQDQMPD